MSVIFKNYNNITYLILTNNQTIVYFIDYNHHDAIIYCLLNNIVVCNRL